MIIFNNVLETTKQYLNIVGYENKNSRFTQLVIGEMHFLPLIQCEELKILLLFNEKFDLRLIGQEGSQKTLMPSLKIDAKKAAENPDYMQKLLKKKINAITIFKYAYPKITVKTVDDLRLKELAGYIDKRCYELFCLKGTKGGWHHMNENEKIQYNYWFNLLKKILLGDRSDFMIKNLYDLQCKLKIPFSILICGTAHTPYLKEYAPYSVIKKLQCLPVNYIIATLPLIDKFFHHDDPWNFYIKKDPTEISPYTNN